MVTEGLDVFRVNVPSSLVNKRIADSSIRERTGCNVVAISTAEGQRIVPGPEQMLPSDAELVLIGSIEAEEQFLEVFGGGGVQV
jgi:K+/H+ antiporter YhaU regulatory subunit KhtT